MDSQIAEIMGTQAPTLLELELTEVKEAQARLEEDMRLLKEELKKQ